MEIQVTQTRKIALGIPAPEDFDEELPTEAMTLNMGPSHPAVHGTVRIVLTVEGETVTNGDVQIGYLHRCFEKETEHATYTQCFPYTDRLNYVSPMCNNVGFAIAVEKALGITDRIPERAQYIRVIVSEMARISDHLTCCAASGMELGAFTVFLWMVKAREFVWELLEELCGARLTHSYVRVGGVSYDLTPDFAPRLRDILVKVQKNIVETERLLTENRIFCDRMDGVGVITSGEALSYGWTGPALRSTGVAYDVRKDHPYSLYERFDFDVPVGSTGDNYDRFAVRMEEMQQSMRILDQALRQIEPGAVVIDDPQIILPPKSEVYNTIEAMISHFKIIVDGVKVPPGETYSYTEAGNGELGFYLVSDGTGRPWRCRCRPPCFYVVSAMPEMLRGLSIADIVPTFGMMNMIGGECDR
jgi:NADH-quinone oxidoreductase subunit D